MTVDLHSHIIFGIDDGSKSLEMSIELAKQAVEVGIKHIIATPHYNDHISNDFFDIRDNHLDILNQRLKSEKIDLVVEAATEVAFLSDWDTVLNEPRCFIRGKYVLVEFPDHSLPQYYLDIIFKIKQKELIPIIAHPERCMSIQNDLNIIHELIRMGCHFQCDAGSLLNHFGRPTKKCAEKLISMNVYHFYGSDAHEPEYRNYFVLKNRPEIEICNNLLIDNSVIPEIEIHLDYKKNYFKKVIQYFKE